MPFFDIEKNWEKEWKGMPEFCLQNKKPILSVTVHFETMEDVQEFSNLIERKITRKTKYLWFPIKKREKIKQVYKSDL